MAKTYCITLERDDWGQLLDGLECRAESWERTSDYLRHGTLPDDGDFLVEECHKWEEAQGIAEHYRSIIGKIQTQMEAQR